MNKSLYPNNLPCLTALLKILLRIYPLPSLEGITPSLTKKVTALAWSVITFKEKLVPGFLPY